MSTFNDPRKGKGENVGNVCFLQRQRKPVPFDQCYKRAIMALDRSPESFSPQMNSIFFVPFVPTCDPRGGASFDPKGHHMNKIDNGLQGDAIN